MPQKGLNVPDVNASLQQRGRKRVTKHVRRNMQWKIRQLCIPVDNVPHRLCG